MHYEEVLELQMELFQFWQGEKGQRYASAFTEDRLRTRGESSWLIANSAQIELVKMAAAEPIYVSEDIQTLIETASTSFEPEPLYPSDLITERGFVLFPRAFIFKDINDKNTTFRAISWYPAQEKHPETQEVTKQGIIFSLYSHRDDEALEDYDGWYEPGQGIPTLTLLHIDRWWFNEKVPSLQDAEEHFTPKVKVEDALRTYLDNYRIMQTFFRLSMQYITTRDTYTAPRSTRRRIARANLPEKYMTVIRLRRPKSKSEGEPKDIHWTHRWIVNGFWRNQWFPSLETHRQIYVASYIKGPEDLPLVIRKGRAFEFVK